MAINSENSIKEGSKWFRSDKTETKELDPSGFWAQTSHEASLPQEEYMKIERLHREQLIEGIDSLGRKIDPNMYAKGGRGV